MRCPGALWSTTLLALHSCSTVNGAPVADTAVMMFDGQPQPSRWMLYDLEMPFGPLNQSEIMETSIERRTQVTACERVAAFAASCFVIGNSLKPIVTYLGNVIINARDQRSCGTFTGAVSGVTFRYQANGKNCDTTAEEATIQGAIAYHLSTVDNGQLCATECLDLTHGGTWDGYLLIGPTNSFDSSAYCGPQLTKDMFSKCSSGGKKDVPK
ncbi:hypothetical protein DOTSEDRAFT_74790 [Dothistroma septosporum NZE10]|uniref:Secreted protein CSS2 C-terminal domain-containing protein n=1 Tax=Dothistroma septosporum (strain NZE10 / CBS 128990) TaxID=675120 RepID=N1PFF9_DOTSN|nr:hypothetical protein DOTSEDRAFT_74790 [Dothistroma septosporum NZE10]